MDHLQVIRQSVDYSGQSKRLSFPFVLLLGSGTCDMLQSCRLAPLFAGVNERVSVLSGRGLIRSLDLQRAASGGELQQHRTGLEEQLQHTNNTIYMSLD